MRRAPDILVVGSHPDDETIFFSSVLLKYKKRCQVICITDGNADGLGVARQLQLQTACAMLGTKHVACWKFRDQFEERLDVAQISERLSSLGPFTKVFTHGIIGEYGHRHHQDVSFAVHNAFSNSSNVYSCAYNAYPDLTFKLTPAEFKMKTKVLWTIYGGEVKRLLHFLPATSTEGFAKVHLREVSEIYSYLTGKSGVLNPKNLKKYSWMAEYLTTSGNTLSTRVF